MRQRVSLSTEEIEAIKAVINNGGCTGKDISNKFCTSEPIVSKIKSVHGLPKLLNVQPLFSWEEKNCLFVYEKYAHILEDRLYFAKDLGISARQACRIKDTFKNKKKGESFSYTPPKGVDHLWQSYKQLRAQGKEIEEIVSALGVTEKDFRLLCKRIKDKRPALSLSFFIPQEAVADASSAQSGVPLLKNPQQKSPKT